MGGESLALNAKQCLNLFQKNPSGDSAPEDVLLCGSIPKMHPVKLQLTCKDIARKAATKTKGVSGLFVTDVKPSVEFFDLINLK